MSILADPAFWVLAIGFGLILYGMSPLARVVARKAPASPADRLERGCVATLIGIAAVGGTTVAKVFG